MTPFSSSTMVSEGEGTVQLCGFIMNGNGGIVTSQNNITVFYSTSPGTAQGKLFLLLWDIKKNMKFDFPNPIIDFIKTVYS